MTNPPTAANPIFANYPQFREVNSAEEGLVAGKESPNQFVMVVPQDQGFATAHTAFHTLLCDGNASS